MVIFPRHLFLTASFLGFIALNSCQDSIKIIDNADDFYRWINKPENGLVKTKLISGIKLTVKYLPDEYLAYQELKNEQKVTVSIKDSVLALYKDNLTFLLTIGPDERKAKGIDIMHLGIRNYGEYSRRAKIMNFDMHEYVMLRIDHQEHKPVLSSLENVYGLSKQRSLYLVFSPGKHYEGLRNAKKLDFVFNDEIFNTGISHFIFLSKNLEKIPSLSFFTKNSYKP